MILPFRTRFQWISPIAALRDTSIHAESVTRAETWRCCVLARSTTITHPLGTKITTPLLIPSFSSRGFRSRQSGEKEVGKLFNASKEQLTESMLISAYDLFHKHLKPPARGLTNITFVDSGGYEIADYQDLSEIFLDDPKP